MRRARFGLRFILLRRSEGRAGRVPTMAKDDISQDRVNAMMVKCGRRCCICRRFRPTRLQVHHIVERSRGGTDDEDNLIVICMTCHSDVHSQVPFMRRFTVEEQKGHRDALVKQVADGVLPAVDTDDTDEVLARIAGLQKPKSVTGELMEEGIEVLVGAATGTAHRQGSLMLSLSTEGFSIMYGDRNRDFSHNEHRLQARCKRAMRQLMECGLIESDG